MANEVTNSVGGTAAEYVSAVLHENLYDASDLRALMTFIPWQQLASDTAQVTTVTRGSAMSAASSEISGGGSNTALTTSSFDLQIARYYMKQVPTDLFALLSPGRPLDVDYVVSILSESLGLTLTDLLCALASGVSSSVGTSGVDLSTDDVFDGIYTINTANGRGRMASILHNVQINNLIESIRGEGGAMQWTPAAQGAIQSGAGTTDPRSGFRFSFAGVDFYQSDSIATANAAADRDGLIFVEGAFAYTLGDVGATVAAIPSERVVMASPEMFIEVDRDPDNGLTQLYANAYPAVAEAEDGRACRIVTDA